MDPPAINLWLYLIQNKTDILVETVIQKDFRNIFIAMSWFPLHKMQLPKFKS